MDSSTQGMKIAIQGVYNFMVRNKFTTLGITFSLWDLFVYSMIACLLVWFIKKWMGE